MDKITPDKNPILFEYLKSHFESFFMPYVTEFILQDYSAQMRFVIREGKRILQQKNLIRGCFSKSVIRHSIHFGYYDDWLWMDVPLEIEND